MTTATKLDREAFSEVARELATVRAGIESRGGRPSQWQLAEFIYSHTLVTAPRLDRLVALGWVERRPSGGFGPEIRIKPIEKA